MKVLPPAGEHFDNGSPRPENAIRLPLLRDEIFFGMPYFLLTKEWKVFRLPAQSDCTFQFSSCISLLWYTYRSIPLLKISEMQKIIFKLFKL